MNIIKLGDSRELLKELSSGLVQTCYFDPPFNSNRNYRLDTTSDVGFDDKFTDDEYVQLIDPMLQEISRVLKSDGSLFFHISADQMLIPHMLCSKHFKKIQPIFWKRSRSKNNTKTKLGACTDVIFWCSNSSKPKFNMVYQPLDEYYSKNSYKNLDNAGYYALGHICYTKTQAPCKGKDSQKPVEDRRYYSFEHNGKEYNPKHGWRLSKAALQTLADENRVHFPNKDGANPYKKIYKHESLGKPSTDYWDDIHSIAQGDQKRKYPTQKPVSLLERIVLMSTDEGDIVLDPVAGSGTTGVAAKRLKREYILFDKNPKAVILCRDKLETEVNNGL